MTAPDPRLEEIAANVSRAESRDYPSFVIATTHAAYLLAELRKAQDKLARVEGLHRPARREHTKYNAAGTLLTYTVTEDGPCVACYPDRITEHCEGCDYYDDTCGGVTGPIIHPWPCPTAAAVADATGGGE